MAEDHLFVARSCHFSPCRRYRYALRIIWNPELKPKMFIGLNPSTADETKDDNTIRRCIDFAQRWGHGGLVMTNAFAFRSTDPEPMIAMGRDAIGPENTVAYLERIAAECAGKPIAAWGTNIRHVKFGTERKDRNLNRNNELKVCMGPLDCLRITKGGYPEHPLYLPKVLEPIPFNYTQTWESSRG